MSTIRVRNLSKTDIGLPAPLDGLLKGYGSRLLSGIDFDLLNAASDVRRLVALGLIAIDRIPEAVGVDPLPNEASTPRSFSKTLSHTVLATGVGAAYSTDFGVLPAGTRLLGARLIVDEEIAAPSFASLTAQLGLTDLVPFPSWTAIVDGSNPSYGLNEAGAQTPFSPLNDWRDMGGLVLTLSISMSDGMAPLFISAITAGKVTVEVYYRVF